MTVFDVFWSDDVLKREVHASVMCAEWRVFVCECACASQVDLLSMVEKTQPNRHVYNWNDFVERNTKVTQNDVTWFNSLSSPLFRFRQHMWCQLHKSSHFSVNAVDISKWCFSTISHEAEEPERIRFIWTGACLPPSSSHDLIDISALWMLELMTATRRNCENSWKL